MLAPDRSMRSRVAVDADVSSPAPTPRRVEGDLVLPARTHRVRARLVLAFAAWNVWVWTTRAVNMVGERQEWSVPFVVVHLLLFAGGLGGALVLGVIGWRMRREAGRR